MNYEIYQMKKNINKISSTNIYDFLLKNEDLSCEDMDFFCQVIASRHDGYDIYWTAKKVKNANISVLQRGLLKCEKMEYVEAFIEDIDQFSYGQLYNDLVELKDGSVLVKFHTKIKGLDINKIEDIAIKISDDTSLLYVLSLEQCNFKRIHDAIIASGCKEAMFTLAFIYASCGTDISKIEDRFIELGANNYILDLAIHVPSANKEKLFNATLNIKNIDAWINFARDVDGIDIKKVENKLVALKNIPSLVRFAKEVNGADVKKLEDIVVKSRDINSMVEFLEVKGANRDRLLQGIVDSRDEFIIENVAIELSDSDYKLLMKKYKKVIGRQRIRRAKIFIDEERRIFKESVQIIEEMMTEVINTINNKK